MADNKIVIELDVKGDGKIVAAFRGVESAMGSMSSTIAGRAPAAAASLQQIGAAAEDLNKKFDDLLSIGKLFAAFEIGGSLVKSLVDTTVAAQNIHYSLLAGAGSAEKAGEEFNFIATQADRLGVNLEVAGRYYGSFLVSSKAANVSLKDTHDLFRSTSEAATVFHLSGTRLHSVMYALEQMMSMGAIRTQELKIQLGQALPGAYEHLAKILKGQGKDLTEELRKGSLDMASNAKHLSQAIRNAFNDDQALVAEAGRSMNAEIGRLQTSIFRLKAGIGEGIFGKAVTDASDHLRRLLDAINDSKIASGAVTFGLIGAALGSIGVVTGLLTTRFRGWTKTVTESTVAATEHLVVQAQEAKTAAARAAQSLQENNDLRAKIQLRRQEVAQLIARNEQQIIYLRGQQAAALALGNPQQAAGFAAQEKALHQQNIDLVGRRIRLEKALQVAQAERIGLSVRAAQADVAASAASNAAAAGTGRMQLALNGLKSAGLGLFNLMGGWIGILMMAGAAFAYWYTSESEAEKATKELTAATKELNEAQEDGVEAAMRRMKVAKTVLEDELVVAEMRLADAKEAGMVASVAAYEKEIKYLKSRIEYAEKDLAIGEKRLAQFNRIQAALDGLNKVSVGSYASDLKETKRKIEKLKKKGRVGETASEIEMDADLDFEELYSSYITAYRKETAAFKAGDMSQKVYDDHVRQLRAVYETKLAELQISGDLIKARAELARLEAADAAGKQAIRDEKERVAVLGEVTRGIAGINKQTAELTAKEADLDPIEQQRAKSLEDLAFRYAFLMGKLQDHMTGTEEEILAMKGLKAANLEAKDAINLYADARKHARDVERQDRYNESLDSLRDKYARGKEPKFSEMGTYNLPENVALRKKAALDAFDKVADANKWAPGTDKYNQGLKETLDLFNALETELNSVGTQSRLLFTEIVQSNVDNLANSMSGFLDDLRAGKDVLRSFGDALKSFGMAFVNTLQQMIVKMMALYIMQKLTGLVFSSQGPASAGQLPTSDGYQASLPGKFGTNSTGVGQVIGNFSDSLSSGAMIPSVGSPMKYVSGAQSTTAGQGTQVNVINNTGQESTTERTKGPNGEDIINVIVGKVAADIRSNGPVGQAVQGSFGLSRKGVPR